VADLGLLERSGNLFVIVSQIDDLMRLPLLNTILKLNNFAYTMFADASEPSYSQGMFNFDYKVILSPLYGH
jgi:hypothetical protein